MLAKTTTGQPRKDYLSGIEISGTNFEAIMHSEGRAVLEGTWKYEYVLRDHTRCLGKGPQTKATRVVFRPGSGTSLSVLATHTYYPFGMENMAIGTGGSGYDYKYNGKELDASLGLYDYGARWYDPAVARWLAVDPLADQYRKYSPYNYTANNPIRYIDPDGMRIDVKTTTKEDGSSRVKIKYSGVLQTEGVDLSRKELNQFKSQIKSQLKSSFSVNSEGVKSTIKIKLRTGGKLSSDDNRIILTNAGNANLKNADGQAPNGFNAYVNIEKNAEEVVKNAAHEVGHNMGLPHNVSEIETRTETKFGINMTIPTLMQPNTIAPMTPAAGNLMLPGTQVAAAGTSITPSQILHISQDAALGKLNRNDVSGGSESFGIYPTDRPLVDINGNVKKE
ncbi:RHS repeat-associated core domain-containing protein [Neolewinella lacunae]|uniref:RHS repeat-associated core domain-containing protein n=1 Tax=Neolewinella lacunae TaxID=1517758 RepID=A0A923T7V0_9BACT|nr:RHS repeat-associated core domain-containing protein [Neolewinella lacunae]MBC6993896.1 hypothetical protein [Neolewinella lacunae]MDN3636084.1 RHS repeat-associated core domain-containing protein [Neolewinella lacunae]